MVRYSQKNAANVGSVWSVVREKTSKCSCPTNTTLAHMSDSEPACATAAAALRMRSMGPRPFTGVRLVRVEVYL